MHKIQSCLRFRQIQRKTSSQKQLSMELSASRCFSYFLCDLVITELCQWPEKFLKPLISNRFPLSLWRIQCNKFHIHAVESKMILFMYDICFGLTFSLDEKFRISLDSFSGCPTKSMHCKNTDNFLANYPRSDNVIWQ